MERKRVKIKRSKDSSKVFFRIWEFRPPEEELKTKLMVFATANDCSYYDASHLSKGEVELCFNPLVHTRSERRRIENEVKSFIETHN